MVKLPSSFKMLAATSSTRSMLTTLSSRAPNGAPSLPQPCDADVTAALRPSIWPGALPLPAQQRKQQEGRARPSFTRGGASPRRAHAHTPGYMPSVPSSSAAVVVPVVAVVVVVVAESWAIGVWRTCSSPSASALVVTV